MLVPVFSEKETKSREPTAARSWPTAAAAPLLSVGEPISLAIEIRGARLCKDTTNNLRRMIETCWIRNDEKHQGREVYYYVGTRMERKDADLS